jgi:hypothetical protein
MRFLSNQQIINDINETKKQYIKTRPEMFIKPYVNNREKYNLGHENRVQHFIGGFKSMGQHPFPYGTSGGDTSQPDPLITRGATSNIYGAGFATFADYNNRDVNRGGALLSEKFPLHGGFYSDSESDSESDYSSSDDEGGFLSSSSEENESSDEEGAGIYDDYVKPAGQALGRTLFDVGKHAFHDVVVPIGKDLLKKAIMGAVLGAGHRVYGGRLTGSKAEFIHILSKIDPSFKPHRKNTKNDLRNEVYKHLESTMKKKDLETLHYLDTLASYHFDPNQQYGAIKGGLGGNKKELEQIIKKMYPSIDFKRMKKEEIIKIIKHGPEEEKEDEEVIINHPESPPSYEESQSHELIMPEPVKRGRPAKKRPMSTKIIVPVSVKEPVKRGRPAKPKAEKAEPKKRGAKPKVEKLVGTRRGNNARGAIVAEIMKKKGLSLGQASKYVSENKLY